VGVADPQASDHTRVFFEWHAEDAEYSGTREGLISPRAAHSRLLAVARCRGADRQSCANSSNSIHLCSTALVYHWLVYPLADGVLLWLVLSLPSVRSGASTAN